MYLSHQVKMPNIKEACKEYFRLVNPDEPDSAGNVDVNMNRVKVEVVGNPAWRTLQAPTLQPEAANKVSRQ